MKLKLEFLNNIVKITTETKITQKATVAVINSEGQRSLDDSLLKKVSPVRFIDEFVFQLSFLFLDYFSIIIHIPKSLTVTQTINRSLELFY